MKVIKTKGKLYLEEASAFYPLTKNPQKDEWGIEVEGVKYSPDLDNPTIVGEDEIEESLFTLSDDDAEEFYKIEIDRTLKPLKNMYEKDLNNLLKHAGELLISASQIPPEELNTLKNSLVTGYGNILKTHIGEFYKIKKSVESNIPAGTLVEIGYHGKKLFNSLTKMFGG